MATDTILTAREREALDDVIEALLATPLDDRHWHSRTNQAYSLQLLRDRFNQKSAQTLAHERWLGEQEAHS